MTSGESLLVLRRLVDDAIDDELEALRDEVEPVLETLERVVVCNLTGAQGQRRALALIVQLRDRLGIDTDEGERERLTESHERRDDR